MEGLAHFQDLMENENSNQEKVEKQRGDLMKYTEVSSVPITYSFSFKLTILSLVFFSEYPHMWNKFPQVDYFSTIDENLCSQNVCSDRTAVTKL